MTPTERRQMVPRSMQVHAAMTTMLLHTHALLQDELCVALCVAFSSSQL